MTTNNHSPVTIEEILTSNAGAHLFNGITRMGLVHAQDGQHVYLSQRREITRRFIGMLLEGGLIPKALR